MGLQTHRAHRDGGTNNAGCEDVNQLKMQIRKTMEKLTRNVERSQGTRGFNRKK